MADVATILLDHGRHDRLAVAAEADRATDRDGARRLGRALLAACTDCASLHADLLALATALESAATPRRTRDFTLSAADAERLRPHGLRTWLARIGTSRDTITRPLAIGFTTLGLAGLLVATAPTVLPFAAGGAGAGGAAVSPAGPVIGMEVAPAAAADGGLHQHTGGGPGTTSEAPVPTRPGPDARVVADEDASRLPVMILSGAFLALGGGLLALRRQERMR